MRHYRPADAGNDRNHLQDRLIAAGYRKPIILMSALSEEDVDAPVTKTAAFDFLRKPFSDERLIKCLDRALGPR